MSHKIEDRQRMKKVFDLYKKISIHYKILNFQFYIQSLQRKTNLKVFKLNFVQNFLFSA